MVYNDVKNTTIKLARRDNILVVFSGQSSQWAFELVAVMKI